MKPVHLLMAAAVLGVAVLVYLWSQSDAGGRQGVRSDHDGGRSPSAHERRVEEGREEATRARKGVAAGELALQLEVLMPDGKAAAGATVEVRDPYGRRTAVLADEKGRANLEQIAPGLYSIAARKGDAVGTLNFELKDSTEPQTIRLADALSVRGSVLDGQGKPIADATVEALHSEGRMNRVNFTAIFRAIGEPDDLAAYALTDETGAYELLLPGAGDYALRAHARGYGQESERSRAISVDVEGTDFHLFAAALVEGRVVNVEGQPVAGAHVFLANMMAIFGSGAPKVEGIADAQGHFVLHATATVGGQMGGTILTARAPGYAARLNSRISVPARDVELVLERGATLTMRTMDASMPGRPAPNVTVAVIFGDGFAQGKSDGDGNVVVENLPTRTDGRSKERTAILTSSEFVPQMKSLAKSEVVDGVLAVGSVPMERGGIIRGVARNAVTNEPVPNAIVQAIGGLDMQLAMMGGSIVRSDAKGEFELRGVPLKAMSLLGRHPDFYLDPRQQNPMFMRGMGGGTPGAPLFTDGKTELEKDVLLTPGATLSGAVTDAAGEPVAGAKVTVQLSEQMQFMVLLSGGAPTTYTMDDGTFTLSPLQNEAKLKLIATHRDHGPAEAVDAVAGSGASVSLALSAPLDIVGVVQDDQGAALHGVKVMLLAAEQQPGRRRMGPPASDGMPRPAVTDAEGRFVLRNTPRGKKQIQYSHRSFQLKTQPIELGAGTSHDAGTVRLDRGLGISGAVVGPDGKPVAHATVNVSFVRERNAKGAQPVEGRTDLSERTGSEGAFQFYGLAPGSFKITVSSDELYARPLQVVAGSEGHRIEMTEAATLRGRVVSGGKPVAGAYVNARSGEGAERRHLGAASTLSDGTFRLPRLPPNEAFKLEIRHEEFRTLKIEDASATDAVQEFTLQEGRTVEGIVVDDAGQPVAGANVRVFPRYRMAVSGQDGRFRFSGLDDGEISLQLMESGRGFIAGNPIKLAAQESDVRILAVVGRSITGIVLGLDDKPIMNVSINAIDEYEKQVASTWVSTPDGKFELRGVPPGTYTVRAVRWQTMATSAVEEEMASAQKEGAVSGVVAGARDVEIRIEK